MSHHRETLCVFGEQVHTNTVCIFSVFLGQEYQNTKGILFKFGAADLTNSYANGVCAPNSCVNGVAAFITVNMQ